MKKIIRVAAGILLMIMVGIIFISANSQDTEITKNKTRVGFVLNGSIDDNSWGESHYLGIQASAQKLNLEVIYKENVLEDESSQYVFEELAEAGCEIIIANSFGYGDYLRRVANRYPGIYFFHATGVVEEDNLSTYFGRVYQMRYLSGIVAGLQTDSNEIGYVAAFPIDEVNRGINAFTQGVRLVNPAATVNVIFSSSWTGDDANAEATRRLLAENNKIDVMTVHTDSHAPLELANEKNIWIIGYNLDGAEMYPDTYLTAPVWDWENFYTPRILECLQGKFVSKHYWDGINSGIITLSPFTKNVKTGISGVVDTEKRKLSSGTFDVFYGPIVDQAGNIRIQKGESMSDYNMLNNFDWYVEGVRIYE